MKKSLFTLSLIALLAGCSSNSSETSSAAETAEASATWQSAESIQDAPMPNSMGTAVNNTQTTYNNAQTTYQNGQQINGANYDYNTASAETVGNCRVVRDSNNAPIYAQIAKGCYTDSTYTVGKSDTLYLIGYLTGTNADQIASLNGLSTTSKLKVGQVLRVR